MEENNDKWSLKLERRKNRVHDLTNDVNDLQLRNEALLVECQNYKTQGLGQQQQLHSLNDEKTHWKVEAEQEKYKTLEATVTTLQEQLAASQKLCREAERATDQVELRFTTAAMQTQATLTLVQEELCREQQLNAELVMKVTESEEKLTTLLGELEGARSRYRDSESSMGQKSSEYVALMRCALLLDKITVCVYVYVYVCSGVRVGEC